MESESSDDLISDGGGRISGHPKPFGTRKRVETGGNGVDFGQATAATATGYQELSAWACWLASSCPPSRAGASGSPKCWAGPTSSHGRMARV